MRAFENQIYTLLAKNRDISDCPTMVNIARAVYEYCGNVVDIRDLLIEKAEEIANSDVDHDTYASIIRSLPSVFLMSGGMWVSAPNAYQHFLYVQTCDSRVYAYTWLRGGSVHQMSTPHYGTHSVYSLSSVTAQFGGVLPDDTEEYACVTPIISRRFWIRSAICP